MSRDELRSALARGGARPSRRPAVIAAAPEPAWDWQTGDSTSEASLRDEIARLEGELDAERLEVRRARVRESELRGGLASLAMARPWNRRRVVAELRDRRML